MSGLKSHNQLLRQARRTGVLSLVNKELDEIPKQVFALQDHLEKDENFWECMATVKMDLSHNSIKKVPEQFGNLNTLLHLKITNNKLDKFPDAIFQLNLLQTLDLSSNLISGEISFHIGNLRNLKSLSLAQNKISCLPDTFGELTQLESLALDENQLRTLPHPFGNLSLLVQLTLKNNLIEELPESFAQLDRLSLLDLSKNKLEGISPTTFVNSLQLTFLDLRQNKLTTFPDLPKSSKLAQLYLGYNNLTSLNQEQLLRVASGLSILDVRDNKLLELPSDICYLVHLKTLDVSNNQLETLPCGIGYMKHLHHLLIDGNPLRSIRRSLISAGHQALKAYLRTRGSAPEGVGFLEDERDEFSVDDLKNDEMWWSLNVRDARASGSLILEDKNLDLFPEKILELENSFLSSITLLNCSSNKLSEMPVNVTKFISLKTLNLEGNCLHKIEFAHGFKNLVSLNLRKNLITGEELEKLFHSCGSNSVLQEVDVRNNNIDRIPFTITSLKCLKTLLISYNRIVDLNFEALQSLSQLYTLDVSNNQIRTLESCLHRLSSLNYLNVENNNLSQIPPEIGLCENLKTFLISGNPQRSVRTNIIAKGTEAILSYLKEKIHPHRDGGDGGDGGQGAFHPKENYETISTSQRGDIQKTPDGFNSMENHNHHKPKEIEKQQESKSENYLQSLQESIETMEEEMEDYGLSQAKKYALKKKLALARAEKIREERRLKALSDQEHLN